MMKQVEEDFQKKEMAKREQVIQGLKEQEEKAESEQAKEEFRADRERLEAAPKPVLPGFGMMDFNKMGLSDPRLVRWGVAELVTGMVLNILLLVSGIGLTTVS